MNEPKDKPKKINDQGATSPPAPPTPPLPKKEQAESTGTGDFWKREKK